VPWPALVEMELGGDIGHLSGKGMGFFEVIMGIYRDL